MTPKPNATTPAPTPAATLAPTLALLLAAMVQGCDHANPDAVYVDTQQGPFPAQSVNGSARASTSTAAPAAAPAPTPAPTSGRPRSPRA